MNDYKSQFYELLRNANRFSMPTLRPRLDALLAEIRREAPSKAEWMEAEEYLPLGFIGFDAAVAKLLEVAKAAGPYDRMRAFAALAKITHGVVATERNYDWRSQALRVAIENDWPIPQLLYTVNWGLVAHEAGDRELRRILFAQAQDQLDGLPSALHDEPVVAEVRLRMGAVEANIRLRDLRNGSLTALSDALPSIEAKQREALQELPGSAHRVVNTRIEFALELVKLGAAAYPVTRDAISRELEAAHRGLDAHACSHCEAYYAEVNGTRHALHAEHLLPSDGSAAMQSLHLAAVELERAIKLWDDHPRKIESEHIINKINKMIDIESRARRVFLSHSSKDKNLVREFRRVLETLRYEPWMDEDAMAAGTPLERGILDGMKASCAAVFFVTANFADRDYLATEVEYAIQQKRAKNGQFAIITLVLGEADDSQVPDLLRTYVYKRPANELEALHELVRALPLAPARPSWNT